MTDKEFREFVLKHREYGFGRMMQAISTLWQEIDPKGALSVGETYGSVERKRLRCAKEGHDSHEGNSYDWCDRCGACLDPKTGTVLA